VDGAFGAFERADERDASDDGWPGRTSEVSITVAYWASAEVMPAVDEPMVAPNANTCMAREGSRSGRDTPSPIQQSDEPPEAQIS